MGLDSNSVRFILYSKTLGIDFSRFAMLGRQRLLLTPSELKENLVEFKFSFDENLIDSIFNCGRVYAESFFQCIGAKFVDSFDYSGYEGATHIHDMNKRIPDQFKAQFSVVFDGGTLEHIFNVPVAFKNCMEMLSIGGHFIGITPTNNFMGHGFYQFSPELFYSIFTERNGFKILEIMAFEDQMKNWYSIKNPITVAGRGRVTLRNCEPTYLAVLAKKIDEKHIILSNTTQSDYIKQWNKTEEPVDKPKSWEDKKIETVDFIINNLMKFIKRYFHRNLRMVLRRSFRRLYSGFSRRFFTPINLSKRVKSSGTAIKLEFSKNNTSIKSK